MANATGQGRTGGTGIVQAPKGEALSKVLPPPELLRDDNAISIWQSQCAILVERKTLTLADAPVLLAYCNSFSMYLEAEKDISKDGLTEATTTGGTKKNPAVNARQDALGTMARFGGLLGLDPTSYARMRGVGGGGNSASSEFDEF